MAAGVRIKVRYPNIDFETTRNDIHKSMLRFIIGTLRTWVLETVSPIPVWSGAARASFLSLAAKAVTSITINPIAPDPPGSRIPLGEAKATATIISNIIKGEYGWKWRSTLAHISIVEDRVGFISAGFRSLQGKTPILPQPKTKPTKDK